MKRVWIPAAVVVVALALPRDGAAQTQDKVATAKKYFEAGKVAYESGQYLTAAIAFEQAYAITPLPPIAFSMAQAYRKRYFEDKDAAKLKRAVDLYRRYLEEQKTGGRREDAITNLSDLEPILARMEAEARAAGKGPIAEMPTTMRDATRLMVSSRTRGARATIDGEKPEEVTYVREVAPGKHKVRVEAEGYFPDEVEALAVEGEMVVVEVNLRERPARLTMRTESGAALSIDGRPVGETPFAGPVELAAGKRFLSLSKRGRYAWSREVTLERGQALALDADLEKTNQRVASYWVLGGAGALAIGGGVTTVLALVAQGDAQAYLDKLDGGMTLTLEEAERYEKLRERRDRMVTASYILYGSAVVVGVTGLLLYFVDSPRVEAPPATTVVPTVTDDAVGAVWSGTF